jgi:transcription-repair coupling factor (superfamily II helicase)
MTMENILSMQPKQITKDDLIINNYYININDGICLYKGTCDYDGENVFAFKFGIIHGIVQTLYMKEEELVNLREYDVPEGKKVRLTKLRTNDWFLTRQKIEDKINKEADELIDVYARRLHSKGFRFDKDNVEQKQFEDEFEYIPTTDQLQSVQEIKKDMESSKPMDRILIGDVGYGKTEVAMRAIFKCAIQGHQAIMLAPTNLLASQHHKDFLERFKNYNDKIKIGFLNSKSKPKDKQQMIENIANGTLNIVVSTHSILADNIKFHDLRLLCVDEEQKFGIISKEKLKKLKSNLDVLSMSATPIPRTLFMCNIGLRDISVLTTPPKNKKAIDTKNIQWNDNIITEYIARELDRQGQIYFIDNDIEELETMKQKLLKLVPFLRIAIVHGKLKKKDSDLIMKDFITKKYDLLLATTVIEVGVTVKNCNSIIIYKAESLGISQLHQLRGRCGRNSQQAYCLLVTEENKQINNISKKRLRAMEQHSELGGGIELAKEDMIQRGSGSIIDGKAQKGHMGIITYEYYIELLENYIKNKKVSMNLI